MGFAYSRQVFCTFFSLVFCFAAAAEILTLKVPVEGIKGEIWDIELHYPKAKSAFALKAQKVIHEDFPKLIKYFRAESKSEVHILVENVAYEMNGSATVFPRNLIRLNDYPASGDEHLAVDGDWVRGLLVHEFVHILQMDMTSGWIDPLRKIFGSTFKWNGLTPRWFTEGLAVWAESEYTGDGRLNSEQMKLELARSWEWSGRTCKTLDCLDQPAMFPYRQYPYWVGGQFLSYIEKQKAKSLSCLVNENSGSFPFFLNSAFKSCTGKTAQEWFEKFYHQFMAAYPHKKNSKMGYADWQRGSVAVGKSSIAYIEFQNDLERLVRFDVRTGKKEEFRFDDRVRKIYRHSGKLKSNQVLIALNPGYLAKSARGDEDQNQKGLSIPHVFFNTKTMSVEKEFSAKVGEYFTFLDQNRYLRWSYEKSHWSVSLDTIKGSSKKLYDFPPLYNVQDPILWRGQVVFVGRDSNDLNTLWSFDLQKNIPRKMMVSNNALDLKGACGKGVLIAEGQNNWLMLERPGKALRFKRKKSVFDIYSVGNDSLIHFARTGRELGFSSRSCPKIIGNMANAKAITYQLGNSLKVSKAKAKKAKKLEEESESYPSLRHFMPHYWMFMYSYSNNLDILSANTALNDPYSRHTFDLGADLYPNISKVAPLVGYTRRFDNFSFRLSHNQSYAKTSFSNKENSFTSSQAKVWSPISYKRSNFVPWMSIARTQEDDFFSDREGYRLSLGHNYFYRGNQPDDFVQNLSFSAEVYGQQIQRTGGVKKDFWGTHLSSRNTFVMAMGHEILSKLAYSKMDNKNFRNGIFWGAGAEGYLIANSILHEFYPLAFGDVYGSEIASGRLQFRHRFAQSYKGGDFFPFYAKEWRFLWGLSGIHGQRAFFDGRVHKQRDIYGAHIGVNLMANAFYLLPVEMDLIGSRMLSGDESSNILLLIRTPNLLF